VSGPKPKARAKRAARHSAHNAPAGTVRIESAGGRITATLNRPRAHNRIDTPMAAALLELAERVEDDDSALMLGVIGAGSDFCAGFESDVDSRLVEALAVLSKPTLAIINGDAIDEGLELAMALDLRLARSDARLGLTQLQHGAMPHFGGSQRLPRLAGAAVALRMLLTGESIDGAEAMRVGLVTYVAGSAELPRKADEVAQALLTRGPVAARLVKEAVRKGYDMTLEQGIRLEEDLYALLQTTTDRGEGVRAFLERRKPLFRGA
jgi:enoyl-CoA hydratase/carnithine racemase